MSTTKPRMGKVMPWVIWSIGAIYVLYQFLLQSSTSVMVPCLMQAFHIQAIGVGVLSSSFFWAYTLCQIPAGIMVDRVGPRKVIIFSIIICVLATIGFGVANDAHRAEAYRILMGFATAPAVAIALYLSAVWFPIKKFALLAGLTEAMGMLGGAIGERFLAQCVGDFGWRPTLFISAAVGIFLLIAAIIFIHDHPVQALQKKRRRQRELTIWAQLKSVIGIAQTWWCGLFAGLLFSIIGGFASLWAVPYVQLEYHVNLSTAALVSAMIFIGTAVGAPTWGWLSDRYGGRRPIMAIGTIMSLISMLLFLYLSHVSLAWMYVLFLTLGFGCAVYVLPFAIVSRIMPLPVKGTAMGFINMLCIVIGAPLLQPISGWLLELHHDGDYHLALSVFPMALALGLLVILFIKPVKAYYN